MPVKIARFVPTTMERVEELRRGKAKRGGDPIMQDLLDAVESGEPQDVTLEPGTNPRGLRIAIARAARRRGFAVESFESEDANGHPVVTVVKTDEAPVTQKNPPTVEAKKRGRPRKQELKPDEVDESLQDIATGGS